MHFSREFWHLIFTLYLTKTLAPNKYVFCLERGSKIPYILIKTYVLRIHNGKEIRTIKNFLFPRLVTLGSLHTTRCSNRKKT